MSKTDKMILVASILELGQHITELIESGRIENVELARESMKLMRERVSRIENA